MATKFAPRFAAMAAAVAMIAPAAAVAQSNPSIGAQPGVTGGQATVGLTASQRMGALQARFDEVSRMLAAESEGRTTLSQSQVDQLRRDYLALAQELETLSAQGVRPETATDMVVTEVTPMRIVPVDGALDTAQRGFIDDPQAPLAPGADEANATTRDYAYIENNTTVTDNIDAFQLYQDEAGNRYARVDEDNRPMAATGVAGIDGRGRGVVTDAQGNRYVRVDGAGVPLAMEGGGFVEDPQAPLAPGADEATATTRDYAYIEQNTTLSGAIDGTELYQDDQGNRFARIDGGMNVPAGAQVFTDAQGNRYIRADAAPFAMAPGGVVAPDGRGEPIAPGADEANATTRDYGYIQQNTTLTDTIDGFELYQDDVGNRYVRVDQNNMPVGMTRERMETAGIDWPDWLADGGDEGIFADEAGNRYVRLGANDEPLAPGVADANATTRGYGYIEQNTTTSPIVDDDL